MPIMLEHFKEYVVYSLPSIWTTFAMLYIQEGVHTKKSMQSLISKCNEEYWRQKRKEKMESVARGNTYLAKASTSKTKPATATGGKIKHEKCAICRYKNHKTADCQLKDKPKCEYCKKYNYTVDACMKLKWDKKKTNEAQNAKKGKAKMVALALAENTKTKKVKANNADINEEALNAVREITFLSIDEGDNLIDCDNDVQVADNNDNVDRVYDWLADSGSMLYITNEKNLYSEYNPILHTVQGIGGK
jgi:hypothetical protein